MSNVQDEVTSVDMFMATVKVESRGTVVEDDLTGPTMAMATVKAECTEAAVVKDKLTRLTKLAVSNTVGMQVENLGGLMPGSSLSAPASVQIRHMITESCMICSLPV